MHKSHLRTIDYSKSSANIYKVIPFHTKLLLRINKMRHTTTALQNTNTNYFVALAAIVLYPCTNSYKYILNLTIKCASNRKHFL